MPAASSTIAAKVDLIIPEFSYLRRCGLKLGSPREVPILSRQNRDIGKSLRNNS
jgi:hypothetical protein